MSKHLTQVKVSGHTAKLAPCLFFLAMRKVTDLRVLIETNRK